MGVATFSASSLRKQGPILRDLSIGLGAWVPALKGVYARLRGLCAGTTPEREFESARGLDPRVHLFRKKMDYRIIRAVTPIFVGYPRQ